MLNIARQPFLNRRPVIRVSVILWVLGSILLAFNAFQTLRSRSGRQETSDQLRAVREEIRLQENHSREVAERLREVDLDLQNQQVLFLNHKLAERSFGWSLLFDQLAELLPIDVRLDRLSPRTSGVKSVRGSRRNEERGDAVLLEINGYSRNSDALLDFVDALFEAEAFERPNLRRETLAERGLIRFDVQVTYLPKVAEAQIEAESENVESAPELEIEMPADPVAEDSPVASAPQLARAPSEVAGLDPGPDSSRIADGREVSR